MNDTLYFNILTFSWPREPVTFNFSLIEDGHCQKIHKSIFPNQITSIFPDVLTSNTEFIYTIFTGEREGFTPLTINLQTDNPDFVKRYYDRQINFYFRVILKQIVKVGFIKENQVWLPIPTAPSLDYKIYEKYSLKIHIKSVSNYPEILLSFDGRSKVHKKSIAQLMEISTTNFNLVLHNEHLYKYSELLENEITDYEEVFPVIGFKLFRTLGYAFPPPSKKNKYPPYHSLITKFYQTYLTSPEFKEIIPLHNAGFLKANPLTTSRTNQDGNLLMFGTKEGKPILNISPYAGIKEGGPFQIPPFSNLHFFLIFHKDDYDSATNINKYLLDGLGFFGGLQKFAKVLFHTEPGFSIQFTNKENPFPEIQEILGKRTYNPDVKYFAIYVTPFSRDTNDLDKKEVYYKVKEALLKRNIPSQVIDPTKMKAQASNFSYSLINIAVAIVAKLRGVPWRLHTPIKNELVVGVGAFKHVALDVQYIGSAFSFNNNGTFNHFELFMKHEVDILAGSISRQIREYVTANKQPERLIIHFYKTMSEEELQPILHALNNLGLQIPVFIITINKTVSSDLVAFDYSLEGLMPLSGTYIHIGNNKYLLFNNVRYTNALIKDTEGWQFPIKLKIESTHPDQLKEAKVISDLIQQVYEFSRMYWKSVSHQNLPVTIKYPEMLAQIAPHFNVDDIHYGKDNLWFL